MPAPSRAVSLWILTVVLVLAAVAYQRRTGPTYPYRTSIAVTQGETVRLRLIRSAETIADAEVVVPSPGAAVTGTMFWRRYPTADEWRPVSMTARTDADGASELVGLLPRQVAAGKLEYRLELMTPSGPQRVPAVPNADGEHLVMRFKDPVPVVVLLPHVVMMFLALLLGLRAGLGAVLGIDGWQRFVVPTAVCLTLGGMVLGPIVQKYAFGAYWTGFPFGYDLTDNKTLAGWVGWLLSAAAVRAALGFRASWARALVIVSTLVMLSIYLIPHSLRGSQLDYEKLDQLQQQGIDPRKAIGTSDK